MKNVTNVDKILIFIHNVLICHGPRILYEQLLHLKNTGLYDKATAIYIGILGPHELLPVVDRTPEMETFTEEILSDSKVRTSQNEDISLFEAYTLRWLWDEVQEHENAKILYLHAKGCTKPKALWVDYWRLMMEHYLIDHHETCLRLLDNYDVLGTNFLRSNDADGWWYFGGNFYWTTASYVRTLPKMPLPPRDRFWCEYWIGMGAERRFLCMYQPEVDIAQVAILPEDYTGKFEFVEYIQQKRGDLLDRKGT